ncbi:hypothetical protein [Bradyrhizobium frederickii]|uniref:hypothetical protein n=1 Tax=Bradyrhizobium frederickii TaxID=2560054 RepID=UPI001F40448D|nr:hypothetical protein [Bradyrhizobium frederickii]
MPEPSIEVVPPMDVGPGTGTDGLIPAPPISVEPSGIPTRPTVDVEGRDETAEVLPAQLVDEVPDSPPPSNNAPEDEALPDPAQAVVLCAGLSGEMPGVAISVDPNGMPTGRVDCGLRGDVVSMPAGGCIPGIVVCAMDAVETSQRRPLASKVPECIEQNRRDRDFRPPASFDGCCFRMEQNSPDGDRTIERCVSAGISRTHVLLPGCTATPRHRP